MKLYQLNVQPQEHEGEGEDHDEWFTALGAAKKRRSQLIRSMPADSYKFGADYSIDEVELVDLPTRALVLAILNREYVVSRRAVVEEYSPPTDDQPDEDE